MRKVHIHAAHDLRLRRLSEGTRGYVSSQPNETTEFSAEETLDTQCTSALLFCAGGNPESNTLISDMTTVICLDDYHSLDRTGRKQEGVTALDPKAQNFDLMYEQIKALKEGKPVDKPIYNHVTGVLDPPETIKAPAVSLPLPIPNTQHTTL